ncbi:BQ2448_3679 [Microbotryum intermedium]|uniref:BQ2448_3679 protein n=1 Tax=Microbotryum intermedium TaxID=269621 RepID=A0A238FCK5_9BASI|nr:BQ2448_3679 [Microbotryum intermedium]
MLYPLFLVWLGLSLVNVAADASGLFGQYWPAYGSQKPQAFDWSRTDIGYYFVTKTDTTGFKIPKGQSVAALKTFVSTAHSSKMAIKLEFKVGLRFGIRSFGAVARARVDIAETRSITKSAVRAGEDGHQRRRPVFLSGRYRRKAVFTIGGWTGSRYFSDRVATSSNRASLVAEIKTFLVKYDFDGVDLDWEYPGSQGIGCNKVRATDSANYLVFLKALRAALGSKKLITAAIGASGLIGADGKPLANMSAFGAVFDIVNLMTYDVGGPWSPTSGPNCPLRTCESETSVVQVIQALKKAGIPASKMMLGIPAYGYSYRVKSSTLASKKIDGYVSRAYQAKTSTTPKGSKTDSNAATTDVCGVRSSYYTGQWNYVDLISEGLLSSNGSVGLKGFTRYLDSCSATPFLFNPKSKVMINYDDGYSAGQKTVSHFRPCVVILCTKTRPFGNSCRPPQAYAMSQGLKGVYTFDSTGFSTAGM